MSLLANCNLLGNVSPRAMDQLLGKRPMYQAMLPANLIRGMDETLQETPEDIRNRILKTLKTDKGFLASSIPDLAKQAVETHTLVHYSRDKHDTLRPLSYEELLKHRTRGRWKDQPEQAKKYTEERRKLEKELHKRLAAKGITTNPDNSFLYATLLGHENFGDSDDVKHEAPLTPDLINQSFFDVVGTGKSYTAFGQRGLSRALTRWQKAKDEGKLMPSEYMGMTIYPRIEIITPAQIKPSLVTESIPDLAKQAALKPDVQLQPHQQRILDRLKSGDKRLLLYHGLGSGKSLSSLAAAEAAGGDYTAECWPEFPPHSDPVDGMHPADQWHADIDHSTGLYLFLVPIPDPLRLNIEGKHTQT